jgi:hypothetical protein
MVGRQVFRPRYARVVDGFQYDEKPLGRHSWRQVGGQFKNGWLLDGLLRRFDAAEDFASVRACLLT